MWNKNKAAERWWLYSLRGWKGKGALDEKKKIQVFFCEEEKGHGRGRGLGWTPTNHRLFFFHHRNLSNLSGSASVSSSGAALSEFDLDIVCRE